MSTTDLGARITGTIPVTIGAPVIPVGYAGTVALVLLAARYSLAAHLGAPRIGLLAATVVAIVTMMVVALAGAARPAVAHLVGALAILAAAGIALAYRFSVTAGRHQVITAAVAAVVFLAVLLSGRRSGGWMRLRRVRLTLGGAGVALIAAPMVPGVGQTQGGARLFVHLPGLSVEPGLLGAVLVTAAVASGLAADGDLLAIGGACALRDAPTALSATCIGAAFALGLTVLGHDLGSAVVLSSALVICLAVGTHRVRHPAAVVAALAAGAAIAWPHLAYVSARITNWAHPLAPGPGGGVTQIAAARYALAWGGLLGRGLGSGAVHGMAVLPAARSDYALIQLSSETGVVPALGILVAVAVIAVASWTVVAQARAGDDQLIATGAAVLLTGPGLLLIAGVAGVVPLTGTPVPLFEVGESAAVAAAAATGLLAGTAQDDLAIDLITPSRGFVRLRSFPILAAAASVTALTVAATMLIDEATDFSLTRSGSSPYLLASAVPVVGSDGTLGTIRNAGGETCGGDLTETLTVSCDTAAAELAQTVGRPGLITAAELGLTTPSAVSGEQVTAGVLGLAAQSASAQAYAAAPHPGALDADLAMSAIGQASVRLTPLDAALLGAEIVSGRRVHPYLTAAVCRNGQAVAGYTPARGAPIPGTSLDLPGMAGAVFSSAGTAHSLLTDAAPVARDLVGAKTGTAQLSGGDQIAWLLAVVRYASTRATTRTAVVAVMVLPTATDPQPAGGTEAAAVAGPILDAAATHPPTMSTVTAGTGAAASACAVTKAATSRRP